MLSSLAKERLINKSIFFYLVIHTICKGGKLQISLLTVYETAIKIIALLCLIFCLSLHSLLRRRQSFGITTYSELAVLSFSLLPLFLYLALSENGILLTDITSSPLLNSHPYPYLFWMHPYIHQILFIYVITNFGPSDKLIFGEADK